MRTTRIITLWVLLLCCCAWANAQQQAAKSVFTLTCLAKDGSVLASTHGFFVGKEGEAVSLWKPFVGADRAYVIDARGRRMEVDALLGANELYNVCKFRVKGPTAPAVLATEPQPAGSKAWLVAYSTGKARLENVGFVKAERFMDKYNYYVVDLSQADLSGCPVVNKGGQVLGIYDASSASPSVTDVRLTDEFKLNGLSINDNLLRTSGIRVAMPDNANDALLMLTLSSQQPDSLRHAAYIDDYLRLFPTMAEGYLQKAMGLANVHHFDAADSVMNAAVDKVENKAEAHFDFSKLIYQKELYMSGIPYDKWSLDKALAEAEAAYRIAPLPLYRHQQAQIVYAQRKYQEAYDLFMSLTKDPKFRNGELFFEAASCKLQLKADPQEIVALLDSAVNCQTLDATSAVYLLARGQQYDQMGEYRKALLDYNRYDSLMAGRANDAFYYTRYSCELNLHQYQQALNDIAHAIVLNRGVPAYYAEMAQLQVMVKENGDAVRTADLGIAAFPDYADNYLVKGLALVLDGKKAEGLSMFAKAKEKGSEKADGLMEKYK